MTKALEMDELRVAYVVVSSRGELLGVYTLPRDAEYRVFCEREHGARIKMTELHDHALAQPTPTPRGEATVDREAELWRVRLIATARRITSPAYKAPRAELLNYCRLLADALAQPTPTPRGEGAIDAMCKAYAEETGYYIEFHRGLSSPSADKMRAGMRAALAALTSPTVDGFSPSRDHAQSTNAVASEAGDPQARS